MSNPAQPSTETFTKEEVEKIVRERMESFADDFRKGYYQSDDDNPDDRVDEAIDYALARHLGEPTPVT